MYKSFQSVRKLTLFQRNCDKSVFFPANLFQLIFKMTSKLAYAFAVYCLLYVLVKVDCSIVKPNNVPRIGRSDESGGLYDQEMGYVIKTNKNIPRMGRRNYDSVSCFFILHLDLQSKKANLSSVLL